MGKDATKPPKAKIAHYRARHKGLNHVPKQVTNHGFVERIPVPLPQDNEPSSVYSVWEANTDGTTVTIRVNNNTLPVAQRTFDVFDSLDRRRQKLYGSAGGSRSSRRFSPLNYMAASDTTPVSQPYSLPHDSPSVYTEFQEPYNTPAPYPSTSHQLPIQIPLRENSAVYPTTSYGRQNNGPFFDYPISPGDINQAQVHEQRTSMISPFYVDQIAAVPGEGGTFAESFSCNIPLHAQLYHQTPFPAQMQLDYTSPNHSPYPANGLPLDFPSTYNPYLSQPNNHMHYQGPTF